jgi:hypothetical protein
MSDKDAHAQSAGPLTALVTGGGVLLQMLGLSGVADSVVEWRGFFQHGVMRHYTELIERTAGGTLSPVLSIVVGYLVSCVGFFIAALQTMREHQRYLGNFTLPRDYESVEHAVPYSERGLDRVEAWAQRRARNAVPRLFFLSAIWPLFLMWAVYVWMLRSRRKIAFEMTEAEQNAVRMSGFDYGKASRAEAFAFLKWSLLAVLGFLAILFVSSDAFGI